MRKKLTRSCIEAGSHLPWDLCNSSGRVLFKKGFAVHNEAALERLMGLELFYDEQEQYVTATGDATDDTAPVPVEPPPGSPFAQLDALATQVQQVFESIVAEPAHCRDRLKTLANNIRSLYGKYPSACTAAIHFRHQNGIVALHPVYSVFLAELLAGELGYDDQTRAALTGAALTANLGMFEMHAQWSDQDRELDHRQQAQLRQHPLKSCERLRHCGITDKLWLGIVEQHHERMDGSGYPAGLSGDRLRPESLVIHLVDRYLSFVMPRGRRKIRHPTEALRIIYEDRAAHGEKLVSAMIRQIGVYPPGTPVRLANGEIAVVTRNEVAHAKHPHVVSVARAAQDYFSEPVSRDTRDEKYAVAGLHNYDPETEPRHPATLITKWP